MTRRWLFAAAIGFWLASTLVASDPLRPRLVVDNRTTQNATVQVWRYTGDRWDWATVANVAPRTWVPVFDVRDNDRFRAIVPGREPLPHTVHLYADKSYGGPQDIWLLQ